MIIEVTQADIEAGVQGEPRKCAIALAVQRALNMKVEIGGVTLYVKDGTTCRLPEIVQDFIMHFDYGNPVQPFSFEVDI